MCASISTSPYGVLLISGRKKNVKLDQKFCFWLVQIFLFSLQPKELHVSLVMSLINAKEILMNPEKIPTVVTHHR